MILPTVQARGWGFDAEWQSDFTMVTHQERQKLPV